MSTTKINITSNGRPLVCVSFDADVLGLDRNISESAASDAIAEAMERLAKPVGCADKARAEIDALRARRAPLRDYVEAIARMCSAIFVAFMGTDIDVDIGPSEPAISALN